MAKAQPKNPRNTPAAQERGQDNTAQGNNDDASKAAADAEAAAKAQAEAEAEAEAAAAALAKAASEAEVQAAEAARAEAEAKEIAEAVAHAAQLRADEAIASAGASIAAMAQDLTQAIAPAAPEGPARDEQGRLEYEVVSPLNNGKRHEIGARVWLSDEDAGPLLGHTVKPYTPDAATDDEDEGAAHA
jgi:hypothetical protein